MKITKAHRIRLNPTPDQEQYFWRAAGVARSAFNWALGEYNRRKAEGEKTVKFRGKGPCLIKEFVTLKNAELPRVNTVTTWAYQGAFADAQAAIRNYFTRKKNGTLKKPKNWKGRKDGKPFGWPRFKSRHRTTPSFYLANTALKFDGHNFQFDKKRVGWVNMTEPLRFEGKVMGARVSYLHKQWWLSVQVEMDHEVPKHNDDVVGVDLGIKYLAVTSDGEVFENPKAFERMQRKLRRLQRKLDRQRRANNPGNYNEDGTAKKGMKDWVVSNKMKQTEKQIAKLSYRIACIRNEASHQMTTSLARSYGVIGVEDLNIQGMQQNGRIAKAISDAALYEKRRQLEYKAEWNGGIVVPVDRWFPSSKLCNGCGEINPDLKLSDREWTCQNCGKVNDRDGNASENIRDEAIRILTGCTTQADGINDSALTLSGSGVVE